MWPRRLLAVRRLSGSPHSQSSSSSPSSSTSSSLRVPPGVVRGSPEDVRVKLPLLHDLSDGARRGVPRWVEPTDRPAAAAAAAAAAVAVAGDGSESSSARQSVSVPPGETTPRDDAPLDRSASFLEITYPFSTDVGLRTLYMLADGTSLRAGRFLEELDAFAADVSVRHLMGGGGGGGGGDGRLRPGPAVVTAAHDGLSIFSALSAVHDFRLRGAVVSVGTTSMEVRTDVLRVEEVGGDDDDGDDDDDDDGGGGGDRGGRRRETLLGSCHTIMVARDAATFGRAAVPPLRGGCDEESAERDAEARHHRARRKTLRDRNLRIKPPMPDEVPLLHRLWREAHDARHQSTPNAAHPPAHPVPMNASRIRNLEVMQPKNRNQHGYVFGGYLLRRSLEAAWLSAYKHCGRPAVFAGADDVTFGRPVEVGKVIEVSSRVAFVDPDGSTIRVFVDVNHISLETGKLEPTCEFHFVFHPQPGSPRTPQVQPVTYAQTLLWLEGRRRWLASKSESHHVSKVGE